MNILLDTNILLLTFDETENLPQPVIAALDDDENEVFFSAVNIWEIAIKSALRKPDFPHRPEVMHEMALAQGFTEVPITSGVASRVADLPLLHGDPFDRLLVAQAMAMPARFYTSDRRLAAYSELVTLVR